VFFVFNFLVKVGSMVDVEHGLIQICKWHGVDIHLYYSCIINWLLMEQIIHPKTYIINNGRSCKAKKGGWRVAKCLYI
jgi:hypothetical protein